MQLSNLQKRIISASILAPAVIAIFFFGGIPFYIMCVLAAIICSYEWVRMTWQTSTITKKILWQIVGFFYIIVPLFVIAWLRQALDTHPEGDNDAKTGSLIVLFTIISSVWVADIAAYFVGKNFGKRKLAPSISPNKTWEGFAGAMVFSAIFIYFSLNQISNSAFNNRLFAIIILFVLFSQIGDLFESKVKRIFGVKDSGNTIPGHGGLLDRIDGLLFAFLFLPIIAFLING
jgi:phosphatidate cytidylyltransferase